LPLELSDDDKAPSVAASYERSIDATDDTIVVDTGTQDHQDHVTIDHVTLDLEDSQKQQYPITPELTPEPTNSLGIADEQATSQLSELTIPTRGIANEQAVASQPTELSIPTTGILKGLDSSNVIETPRRRNEQRESYAASIVNLYYNSAYHTAFLTGTNHQHVRIHRTELPTAPYS
jgi:hypothetical protein